MLLVLMGMELGPFLEEAGGVLPLATTDGCLRDDVGLVEVCVFFMNEETKITKVLMTTNRKQKGRELMELLKGHSAFFCPQFEDQILQFTF